MPENHKRIRLNLFSFVLTVLFCLLISSCIPGGNLDFFSQSSPTPAPVKEVERAEVVFVVEIPQTDEDLKHQVYLDVVDEVSGLALNPLRFPMEKSDDNHFTLTLPIKIGSVIKYRYLFESKPPLIEHNNQGDQVRYRMAYITGPGIFEDTVTSWNRVNENVDVLTGRITGKAVDSTTRESLSDIMIAVAGEQTFTSSDGTFCLENIPVGTHNLIAYSLTGQYKPFQQGATVAKGSTTPAHFEMVAPKYVDVTFIVTPPEGLLPGTPIRLIGNIYALGNTFSDLSGGISTLASRAPIMNVNEEGNYIFTMSLPAGLDLRYKYSLGDGFWNAERTSDGQLRIRQLIIPEEDISTNDRIISWGSQDSTPITFTVTAAAETPSNDIVSIQFNPFDWMEPLPMWPLGENKWLYTLYSPPQIGNNLDYRYCRNEQCSTAFEVIHQETNRTIRNISSTSIEDEIEDWNLWGKSDDPTKIAAVDIQSRDALFVTGVEFQTYYHPSWQPYIVPAFKSVRDMGGKWVFITPTWTYTSNNPPYLEAKPGTDMLSSDILQGLRWAKEQQLSTAIFPQINYKEISEKEWWNTAIKDDNWWNNWFETYERYLINFADTAEKGQAEALVIDGTDIMSALPGRKLPDGSKSGVPDNVTKRLTALIEEIQKHYSGKLIWAVSSQKIDELPADLLEDIDYIYILWSEPLSKSTDPTQSELAQAFGSQLDENIKPIYDDLKKSIIIGLGYPSVDGAAKGFVEINENQININEFASTQNTANAEIDLNEQADIYNAAFAAINDRDWISGIISRGYYPPVELQDNSFSIHGKPASDVLWYWLPRFYNTNK